MQKIHSLGVERGGKMNKIDTDWLSKAIETIQNKIADKLAKDNVTVYRVKNIIRVDIKEE